MRKVLSLALFVAFVAAFVGCGPNHHHAVPPRPVAHCQVPKGKGFMGACQPAGQAKLRLLLQGKHPAPKISRPKLGTGYYGADVSNYQGCLSPTRQEVSFLWVKTGEGRNFTDPDGYCTIHNALKNGVPVGAYFFARNDSSAIFQADRFAAETQGNLPGALDYETNDGGLSGQQQCDWIRGFNAEYLKRAPGHPLLVADYSSPGFWSGCSSIPQGVAWIASWGSGCAGFLSGFPYMTVCQFTDAGPFGGDGDVFLRGTPADLVSATHTPPPPPIPNVTGEQAQECSQWLAYRDHKKGDRQSVADVRTSLVLNGIDCDPKPHYTHQPLNPQWPNGYEMGQARILLGYRAHNSVYSRSVAAAARSHLIANNEAVRYVGTPWFKANTPAAYKK